MRTQETTNQLSIVYAPLDQETVDRVEMLDTGELLLGLAGAGNPTFEYVYRAAAGVYWDASMGGFKSTPMQARSASWWYSHMVAVVRSELNVELKLGNDVAWRNLSEFERDEISNLR